MIGAITTRDILKHPIVTIRCFGWLVFVKALFLGQHRTFLSLLPVNAVGTDRASRVARVIQRCIDLELRVDKIYTDWALEFADNRLAKRFFTALASQERSHAELLALCRSTLSKDVLCDTVVDTCSHWGDALTDLETCMTATEWQVAAIHTVEDAAKKVVEIETGEVNWLFRSVITICGSDFTRKLEVFQDAIDRHLLFISKHLPQIAPSLEFTFAELASGDAANLTAEPVATSA
jgi:hypothetical protein